jgi:hypothetical protein
MYSIGLSKDYVLKREERKTDIDKIDGINIVSVIE